MSRENVEVVRRGYEQFSATGEVLPEISAPEFVWDMSHFHGWPEQQLYVGVAGTEAFLSEWAGAWDDWQLDVEALHDAGEKVVALVRQHGRSKAAGMPVEMSFAQVWTVRDGLQTRMEMYSDPREALQAVGLGESATSVGNVEVVRGIYDAYTRRENATPFDAYAPDIEWDISELGHFPIASVYHGHAGVRECFRDLLSAFGEFEIRAEELSAGAADRVLAVVSEHGVGAGSGAAADRTHHAVWTLRDGKVTRMRVYLDRGDAERAAGLAD
jgi:ketosteroid isomerase-like protein